jgi:transposase-like protein
MRFWKALDKIVPSTRVSRCWVRKIANILNKLLISMQLTVNADRRKIWQAEPRAELWREMGDGI